MYTGFCEEIRTDKKASSKKTQKKQNQKSNKQTKIWCTAEKPKERVGINLDKIPELPAPPRNKGEGHYFEARDTLEATDQCYGKTRNAVIRKMKPVRAWICVSQGSHERCSSADRA